MADKTKKLIADTFLAIAEGLETGTFGAKPKIAVTAMGSEHGEETVMEGAVKAARAGADVYFIPRSPPFPWPTRMRPTRRWKSCWRPAPWTAR